MSVPWCEIVWRRAPARGAERLVLLCLAFHADAQGRCYLPMLDIARLTRLSEQSVRRAMQGLREAHWMVSAQGGRGRGQVNIYQLCIPAETRRLAHPDPPVQPGRRQEPERPDEAELRQVQGEDLVAAVERVRVLLEEDLAWVAERQRRGPQLTSGPAGRPKR